VFHMDGRPAYDGGATVPSLERTESCMSDDERPAILVADDQPESVRAISFALEQAGYNVLVATGGCAALRSARANRPDLILLDVCMPDMDGDEVCRRLKQDQITHDIPVILLTSREEHDHLGPGLRAGGVDSIEKPFETDAGLARVRTQLELCWLRRSLASLTGDQRARGCTS
jgi:CheY-like chemotaxis protein